MLARVLRSMATQPPRPTHSLAREWLACLILEDSREQESHLIEEMQIMIEILAGALMLDRLEMLEIIEDLPQSLLRRDLVQRRHRAHLAE